MDHLQRDKVKRNTRNCCVPQCDSRGDSGLSFHQFPKNTLVRKKWQLALRMGKPASDSMRVCGAHFQPTDFFPGVDKKKLKNLKVNVVPSLNLPLRLHDSHETSAQREQREKRNVRREKRGKTTLDATVLEQSSHSDSSHEASTPEEQISSKESSSSTVDSLDKSTQTDFDNHQTGVTSNAGGKYLDKGTPTNNVNATEDPQQKKPNSVSIVDILSESSRLNNFTGLHSFELLDAITECISDLIPEKSARKKDMSLKNRIILTFIKLKLNLSFTSLGILFNISRQTCANYFKNLIPMLAVVLENMIPWPDQGETRGNLPIAFKNFRNTRIVLDCAETPIERSKCLRCRILTYSHYKGRHTAKFDVGVSPSGLIVHISLAYGGRASDKLVVNSSGILNKLDFKDAVMVDKGFKIEEECLMRNLILHRPPFVVQKKQFSRSDAIHCAEIARARVHVERVIQRIREFDFMKDTVPWELIPYFDQALVIVCGIVNLSSPVLNIDKFM